MKKPTSWPLLIVALMIGFVLFSAWSFYRAGHEGSAVTDRNYYSHGLRYNQTLLERQAATSLGWQITPHLEGRAVTIGLRDRDRQVVAGAIGTLHLRGVATPYVRELPLHEIAPGSYRVELPGELRGEQSAEVAFERDGARLSQRLLFAID